MDFKLLSSMIFQGIGGLGIFLLGMKHLSEGIQAVAGNRLRLLIGAVTNNRLIAVTVGLLFTCLVQSSSITTVMVVGLVNSGAMTLIQSIGVIMGANIGTTITGWILVLKVGKYGLPILGAASYFFLFAKKERIRFIAMAIMGVGMVFFGLELMKNGFKPIKSIPEFSQWFALFNAGTYTGIIKCAIMGCLLTFMVQSSSATLGITMGLAATGVINFEAAAALVLGENVGTTITAYLASLGATTNAKRAAYAHIIFNLIGVIWIITIFHFYIQLIKDFMGVDPGLMTRVNGTAAYPYMIQGIATVHTGFNLANTLLFLPFIKHLEKFLLRMVPEKAHKETRHLTRLDVGMLETPMVAIEYSHVEIVKMGKIVREMMDHLQDAFKQGKVNDLFVKKIFHKEEVLDIMQNEISIFLTDLLASALPLELTNEGRLQLRMADEYESISDYVTKLLKLRLRLIEANLELPSEEQTDISLLHQDIVEYIDRINIGCENNHKEILHKAHPLSEAITHKIRKVRTQHLARLSHTRKDPLITMIFADMVNDYRRVKDHALNIAEALAGEK